MVQAGALVAEVAVGRPAALGVVLRAQDHVHAAADDPVDLFAHDEALDGGVADDRDENAALTAGVGDRMAQVGQIEERDAEKLKDGVAGGGFAAAEFDGAREQLPVGLGQAAVGHGAVNHAVVAFAVLDEDAARKQKWTGGGIDDRAAGGADALRAVDLVEAGGVHVEPHVAVVGVDEHVVGAAGNLNVALRLHLGCGAVVDHLVSVQNVIAVVKLDASGTGPDVAFPFLVVGGGDDRNARDRLWFRLSDGQHFLVRIVGKR